MKYMLMMHYTGEGPPIHTWPPEDIKAHIDFMLRFNKELQESGELVAAEGLAGPDQAKVVRAQKAGPPAIGSGKSDLRQPSLRRAAPGSEIQRP